MDKTIEIINNVKNEFVKLTVGAEEAAQNLTEFANEIEAERKRLHPFVYWLINFRN